MKSDDVEVDDDADCDADVDDSDDDDDDDDDEDDLGIVFTVPATASAHQGKYFLGIKSQKLTHVSLFKLLHQVFVEWRISFKLSTPPLLMKLCAHHFSTISRLSSLRFSSVCNNLYSTVAA